MVTLDSLIREEAPICYGVLKPGALDPDGVPLVRIVDLVSDAIRHETLFRIAPRLDKEFFRSRLKGGEVLLSIQGTIGRVAIVPVHLAGANISRTIARIALGDEVNANFMRQWLLSEGGQKALLDTIVGTTRASLNIGELRLVNVPLPPLTEQRQIAAVSDAIDDAIRKTEQIIAKLKQVKQGLLHDLLTRGIDDNGELRDPARHPEQFKDSPVGQVPKNWEVYRLAALTALDSPITYGVVKPGEHDENGVLFVRGGDFPDGRIQLNKLRTISRRVDEQYKRTRLCGGELLVSLVGQPGSSAVVPPELAGGNIARQAALVRLRDGISADFVRRYISSNRGQAALLGDTLGSVQQVVNLRDLRGLPVTVPETAEQTCIVRCLAQADATSDREQSELEKLNLLKSGLMEDLLTGRVRVTPLLGSDT